MSTITFPVLAVVDALPEVLPVFFANFHFVLMGIFVGMALGTIPGLGGSATLAILIPFTIPLTPGQAFLVYGGALGATTFSGSITAILFNTPGTASNVATLLDGYPLTRQGRAREAIGAAAMASAVGAVIGISIFVLSIPFLREFALLFGTPELFWLGVLALAVIPAAIPGSLLRGLIAGGLGLMIAFHGYYNQVGYFRFTYIRSFGIDDIGIIPIIMGLFALAEMIKLAGEELDIVDEGIVGETSGQLMEGLKAPFRQKFLTLRCSLIGIAVGAIPGIGGSSATLISYGHAGQSRLVGPKFGEGNIFGVVAAESANDSKDGGQLVPTLGLGIPGTSSMAVLLGAFFMNGLVPGPMFIRDNLDIVLLLVFALLAANILTSVFGVIATPLLVRLVEVDMIYVVTTIVGLVLFSTYMANQAIGDVYLAVIFGILGYIFIKLDITRVPVVLAIVVGPVIEDNFLRGLQLGGGDFGYFFSKPLSWAIILLIVLSLGYPLLRSLYSRQFA